MKILLLPSDYGGGMGHVSRCIYLGGVLKKFGHSVSIILSRKYRHFAQESALQTYQYNVLQEKINIAEILLNQKFRVRSEKQDPENMYFLEFDGLNYQVVRDMYLSPSIVARRFDNFKKIAEKIKPDLIIGDGNFLARPLAQKLNVPVHQIIRYVAYPPKPDFLWWMGEKPDYLKPAVAEVFSNITGEKISFAEEMLKGEKYIVPSIAQVEPIHQNDKREVIFTGPLNKMKSEIQIKKTKKPDQVYVTIGGGAIQTSLDAFFKVIVDTFKDADYKVIVSTAGVKSKIFKNNQVGSITFSEWVDGKKTIQESDLVIFHGGYGTMMEILKSGRPSIIIPRHSEQEGNGRRLEQLKCGKICLLSKPPYKRKQFEWFYGKFEYGIGSVFNLSKESLEQAMETVQNEKYFQSVSGIAEQIRLTDTEEILANLYN